MAVVPEPRRPAQAGRRVRRLPGRRLFAYDRALGVDRIAGADEAGRGCLAGPLVVAAVCFDLRADPRRFHGLGRLDDSKACSRALREELYRTIMGAAEQVRVVVRCAPSIDRTGLHRSNLAGLRDALAGLDPAPDLCLADGFALGPLASAAPCRRLVGGDRTSAAVAAASIVAKCVRDRYMRRTADAAHPGYGFAGHVGYATGDHRAAIAKLGVSSLHRRSFASIAYHDLAALEHAGAAGLVDDAEAQAEAEAA